MPIYIYIYTYMRVYVCVCVEFLTYRGWGHNWNFDPPQCLGPRPEILDRYISLSCLRWLPTACHERLAYFHWPHANQDNQYPKRAGHHIPSFPPSVRFLNIYYTPLHVDTTYHCLMLFNCWNKHIVFIWYMYWNKILPVRNTLTLSVPLPPNH